MKRRIRTAGLKSDEQLQKHSRSDSRAVRTDRPAKAPGMFSLAGNRAISRRVASGLPAELRASMEEMSGVSLGGVRVHPGSSAPEQHDAFAFTQGSDIHLGPGREADLAHEAWHVVQQRQGRVAATGESRGEPLNHDSSLEVEADRMGQTALSRPASGAREPVGAGAAPAGPAPVQLKCRICNASSHKENNCPKNPNKKEEESGGKGRTVTKAGKKEKDLFALILPKLDRESMYGPGAKSLVGGYNGKSNGLRDNSIRIDRQGLGNVQFQIGDDSYACATFEQDAKPGAIIAALYRSLESGENEAA